MTSISRQHLARILKAGKVSWQSTTTWKSSNDADFVAKMQRVLALYNAPPKDGRVICVDEFGPLNLQPRKGKAWRPGKDPRRLRATYNRYGGVMHLLRALDLATGKLYYRIRKRKRWREFLSFCTSLRERWPGGTLYLIVDNYSPAQASPGQSLGRRQRRRAGVSADLQYDRGVVFRLYLLTLTGTNESLRQFRRVMPRVRPAARNRFKRLR
ncbi:hypothetical protein ABT340_31975 [Streptosporangium sp. NPDC000239]|uniref:hypothetical protein n=1 Tax=Streptosporangium sp. NPDC000239 TaxID=3154248 RepID=UPI00332C08AB